MVDLYIALTLDSYKREEHRATLAWLYVESGRLLSGLVMRGDVSGDDMNHLATVTGQPES